MSVDFESLYHTAREWTLEAGKRLKESLEKEDALTVEYKTSAADIVTQKDREMEQFFVERIKSNYPDHKIIGEEGVAELGTFDPTAHTVWIIDPIDGTTNFVHQKQNFAISIAIFENGQPKIGIIYDPIREECFHALVGRGAYLNDNKLPSMITRGVEEAVIGISSLWLTPNHIFEYSRFHALVQDVRGTRSIGSAALEMAYMACGRLDAYISLYLAPWDFAGGYVILKEVGAILTTIENEPLPIFKRTSICAAKAGLHQEMMHRLQK